MEGKNYEKLALLKAALSEEVECWKYDEAFGILTVYYKEEVDGIFATDFWTDGEWILFHDCHAEGYTTTGNAVLCQL